MNPEWLGSSLWAAKATKKQVMNLWRKWDASCALPKLLKSKLCTLKDLESIYELPKLLKSKLWSSESSEKQVKHCNSLKSRFMNCWRNWEAINELPKLLKSKLWATEGTERSSALPKLEKHGCCWSYWAARVPEKHVMNHWRSFPGKQVMNHWRNWEASYELPEFLKSTLWTTEATEKPVISCHSSWKASYEPLKELRSKLSAAWVPENQVMNH
jgi:hypothetical protein